MNITSEFNGNTKHYVQKSKPELSVCLVSRKLLEREETKLTRLPIIINNICQCTQKNIENENVNLFFS